MTLATCRRITITLLSVTLVAACGGRKSNSGSSSDSSLGGAPVDPNAPLSQAQVQGTWKAGCTVDPSDNSSFTDLLIITGNKYVSRSEFSTASDCSNPDMAIDINGTFALGTRSPAVPVATNITMNMLNAGVTLKLAAAVTQANAESWCGLSDWQLNVLKIVPLQCIGLTPQSYDDIVALTGSTLIFGNVDGTALDPVYSYQKQ